MISLIATMLVGQYIFPPARTFVPYYTPLGANLATPDPGPGWWAPPVAETKSIVVTPFPIEYQGIVTGFDIPSRMITLRMRHETIKIHYHPQTLWKNDRKGKLDIYVGYTELRFCEGVATIIEPS